MLTRLYPTLRMLAGSAIAVATLSGCSSGSLRAFFGPPDEEDVAVASPAPPAPAPAPAAPLAARLALPPATATPATTQRGARPPLKPDARDARPVVPAPVVSVAGMSEAEVLSVMGEPQQRSERSGRRTWTYTGAGCRVEVTFFRDVTKDAYAALSQKIVGANGAARETCARSLRSAARQ